MLWSIESHLASLMVCEALRPRSCFPISPGRGAHATIYVRSRAECRLASLLVMIVCRYQSLEHLGRRFEKSLRFRLVDFLDISAAILGRLVKHAFDIDGVVARIALREILVRCGHPNSLQMS